MCSSIFEINLILVLMAEMEKLGMGKKLVESFFDKREVFTQEA